jgi:hypothetical protein
MFSFAVGSAMWAPFLVAFVYVNLVFHFFQYQTEIVHLRSSSICVDGLVEFAYQRYFSVSTVMQSWLSEVRKLGWPKPRTSYNAPY